ncbi:MAG: cell filamentation protein Fic [Candidatus Aegiribacteria sp.]|nr:cell filamentation protein Fic [Candidatus Aegiribacteria sp.]
MKKVRAAGYEYFIEKYQLRVIPHWHTSSVSSVGTSKATVMKDGLERTTFPPVRWPGDTIGDHLEFALKYDGINLGILSAVFSVVSASEIAAWIESKPTGKYTRRIWFLYEFLTGQTLPVNDVTQGNYIVLLESDEYYAADPGIRVKRQRVVNNLLGNREFCPVIRRTEKLLSMEEINIHQQCDELLKSYPPELIRRALCYLYSKETKSSFEIEHLKPSASRVERFIASLEMATKRDFCNKEDLIGLQNRIVDERFKDSDYRKNQNYIGEMISFRDQRIHFVCPKPEDVESLMAGLLVSHANMLENAPLLSAVIHAAIVAFGFVYIHPFEDGNGRIHRFLIHNILFLKNAVPDGLMFPVSAAVLKKPDLYDYALEAFSRPLLPLLKFDLDDLGQMTVSGETGNFYRYIDMTVQAEVLFEFVKMTVDHELAMELDFLMDYDRARKAIQEVIDMPDQKLDLLIKLCLQNNGRLSADKRRTHFAFLKNDELEVIEEIVQNELSGKRSLIE